jgi:hypothetical protein
MNPIWARQTVYKPESAQSQTNFYFRIDSEQV